jgi:hypothetical protein
MKNTVQEIIDGNGRPENLMSYIKWLQAALEKIPEESRAGAYVEIDVDTSFGGCSTDYSIKYERLETGDEYELRTLKEKAAEERRREDELRQLEELKAKYPSA